MSYKNLNRTNLIVYNKSKNYEYNPNIITQNSNYLLE